MPCLTLPITAFAEVAAEWDRLNDLYYRHPLLESRYFDCALNAFGRGDESIVMCDGGGASSAIAIVRKNRMGACNTFQPSQCPLGAFVRSAESDTATTAIRLLNALPWSCQVLALTQQDPDLVPRPQTTGRVRTLDYIDTARITVDRDFADYWASRGRNLRHNLSRQRNRLEREGTPLRVETRVSPDQMAEGVSRYGELESRGWKAGSGTAVHADNQQGRFYRNVLEAYAATGNARIYECYYGDRLTAVDLCIQASSVMVILKTTYDESIRTSSPALLMRQHYFAPLFDAREVDRIEFYGKVMYWHTKWSSEIRRLYHVNAYRSGVVARLHASH